MTENTAQTDLDDRIAIVRRSVSELLEESTGASGAAAEEALADRLREMQDLLDALLKKREAME